MPRLNSVLVFWALLPLTILSMAMGIIQGSVDLTLSQVGSALIAAGKGEFSQSIAEQIILQIRAPRVLLAAICGAGLAICGYVLQGVTRNPLADPYLFGISSGATLGAVVAVTFGVGAIALPFAAFCGALLSVAVVMLMARQGNVERLILAGVAISFLLSSLASLLLYFSDPQAMQAVLFWTMGSFARANWQGLWLPALCLLLILVVVSHQHASLLAMMAGDESAHTQGVAVMPFRLIMLLITSLLTASLVAQCGGIGFVGLMVPHLVRLAIGVGKPMCLGVTALVGALLMIWVDLLCRSLLPAQELPVGVVTAILGSVFFLGMLLKRR